MAFINVRLASVIVNDFMNAEAPVGTIARYNFDLRA